MIYDAIVLGVGGVGSAALYHLAQRGLRVLGIEQFTAGHDLGSSHGQTRIIRKAYFEHPNYVPLLQRAYQLWSELEQQVGQHLYQQTGILEVGPASGVIVPGVLESARRHQLAVQNLEATDVAKRFPGFRVPDGFEAVFEEQAGYLLVEACVLAHIEAARRIGAELLTDTEVVTWNATDDGGVSVETAGKTYSAGRLVITAGSWAGRTLHDLAIDLRVVRKHLHWFKNTSRQYRLDRGYPVFLYEVPQGFYYGFPQIDQRGVKIAEHHGGSTVADPGNVDRSVEADELERVRRFGLDYLSELSNETIDHSVCLYTMSPDEHFVVDRHPLHQHVVLVAGLSGHGFKFTPVLGELMANLVCDETPDVSIDFLRLDRPSLQKS